MGKSTAASKKQQISALSEHFFASVGDDFLLEYTDDLPSFIQHMHAAMEARKSGLPHVEVLPFEHGTEDACLSGSMIVISVKDSPFLVDSIRMELNRSALDLKGMVNLASIPVCRNKKGELVALEAKPDHQREACFLFLVSPLESAEESEHLKERLSAILRDVHSAVSDWRAMKEEMEASIANIQQLPDHCFSKEEREEACAFLGWLIDYFTFLGARRYTFQGKGKSARLDLIKNSGLGVLHDEAHARKQRYYSDMALDTRAYAQSKRLVIVAKTNTRSTIHRPPYTDHIIIKHYDAKGEFVGETRFIGLFTSDAYESDPTRIPFLRKKVENIVRRAKLVENGYAHKRLIYLLKTFPRDELFQAHEDQLFDVLMGVLYMQDRSITKVFFRKDIFHRYVSCLVYLPKEDFTTELALSIERCLKDRLKATECVVNPVFSESALARIYCVVRVETSTLEDSCLEQIRNEINELTCGWKGRFGQKLRTLSRNGDVLFKRYIAVFPAGYREVVAPNDAVDDLMELRQLTVEKNVRCRLTYQMQGQRPYFSFRIYSLGASVPPARSLPVLKDMGLLVESEYSVKLQLPDHEQPCWMMEFFAHPVSPSYVLNDTLASRFNETFLRAWAGRLTSDGLNALVLVAGLDWREIRMLRAYGAYFKQIGFPIGAEALLETLLHYPTITQGLVHYFHKKFQPSQSKDIAARARSEYRRLVALFSEIKRLDEERVMRQFAETIQATARTNYYQVMDGEHPKYLTFKLLSESIPHMPLPAPMYELYVFSSRFEAVHLRADAIARGGLRWSDRDDFRTEVLGLMKAQQVKNALIVPAGAKGGFVLKKTVDSHENIMEEGLACYRQFISAMLQITDNLSGKRIVKPKSVVCHDGDDPYLVVAADKGTSSNSDVANGLALAHKPKPFWLGDAFASGGSNGYDHKAMGITARGGWEAVKWHFRCMERDIDSEPFSVVGIGGMAGDVFGNGMLLSKQIKLVAAFNHNSIFIDPNPSPSVSYKERERLFNQPGSTWCDYSKKALSKGAGIYSRAAKSIELSDEACEVLGIASEHRVLGPDQLIQAILKAPVDLLWNGGIGTYIKAQSESNEVVGDPANDALRVNGRDLRCRIVAEGGNLGATQLGRVEFELHTKGFVNTDFIDNSAGVDCSDREVNIKILLNQLVEGGDLTLTERDRWLSKMEDEVAQLVLANNVDQNLSLSLEQDMLPGYLYLYESFMDQAEHDGLLDRGLEFLPSHQQLKDRKVHDATLTRPELSVLLAYAKNILKDQILTFDAFDDALVEPFLHAAFPASLVKKYGGAMLQHRLQKAILATGLSNAFIADVGLTFLPEITQESPYTTQDVLKAYLFVHKVFNLDALKAVMRDAAKDMDMAFVMQMYQRFRIMLRTSMRWALCHESLDYTDMATMERYEASFQALLSKMPSALQGGALERWQAYRLDLEKAGMSARVAKKIANTAIYYPCLNVVFCAEVLQKPAHEIARFYFVIGTQFSVFQLRTQLSYHDYTKRWEMVGRFHLKSELDRLLRQLVFAMHKHMDSHREIAPHLAKHEDLYRRWQDVIGRVQSDSRVDFSVLFMTIKLLESWVEVSKAEC